MPDEKKEVKEEPKYSVAEIATATEPKIYDGKDFHTIEQALVTILNKIEDMEKKIIG